METSGSDKTIATRICTFGRASLGHIGFAVSEREVYPTRLRCRYVPTVSSARWGYGFCEFEFFGIFRRGVFYTARVKRTMRVRRYDDDVRFFPFFSFSVFLTRVTSGQRIVSSRYFTFSIFPAVSFERMPVVSNRRHVSDADDFADTRDDGIVVIVVRTLIQL